MKEKEKKETEKVMFSSLFKRSTSSETHAISQASEKCQTGSLGPYYKCLIGTDLLVVSK